MTKHKWFRARKSSPCPICHKPDWCTQTDDGLICCMRIESQTRMKNGGWAHSMNGAPVKERHLPPESTPTINAKEIWRQFDLDTTNEMIDQFAFSLGVSGASLTDLGCVWASGHNAFCFPMLDHDINFIGLRLRDQSGHKWAVKGSKAGLFYPQWIHLERNDSNHTFFICEGPTDTAAALTLGLNAIGRPSCLGQEPMILTLLSHIHPHRIVIISDNDGPGYNGALLLQKQLTTPSAILIPPTKDLRSFLQQGGTRPVLDSIINSLIWSKP